MSAILSVLLVFCSLSVTVLSSAVTFEPNHGKATVSSAFVAKTSRGSVYIRANRAEFISRSGSRTVLEFAGASTSAVVQGEAAVEGAKHYVLGADPSNWVRHVPRYQRARVRGVYPGIDILYRETDGRIEFDVEVAAGADVKRVCMRLPRATYGHSGALEAGPIALRRPEAWQTNQGRRVPVSVRFTPGTRGTTRFEVGAYDKRLPLIIDPVVEFATYLGGSDNDGDTRVTTGADGSIFVAGSTLSSDFPGIGETRPTQTDGVPTSKIFVVRMNADASLAVWTMVIGGKESETLLGMRRDAENNIYILGRTTSADFPITPNAYRGSARPVSDLFVAKLDGSSGLLLASTYLGVTSTSGATLALSEAGDVFVGGGLEDRSFMASPGAYQTAPVGGVPTSFVMKLNAELTALRYATYWSSGPIAAIAADAAGNMVVGGKANGTGSLFGPQPFEPVAPLPGVNQRPIVPGQAYVAKLNDSGTALLFATLLHGEGRGSGVSDLQLAPDGTIHLVGASDGTRFPEVNPVLDGPPTPSEGRAFPFLASLSADGSRLIRSTVLYGYELPGVFGQLQYRLVLMPDLTECIAGLILSRSQQTVGGLGEMNRPFSENASLSCVEAAGTAFATKTMLPGEASYRDAVPGPNGTVVLGGSAHRNFATGANVVQRRFGGEVYRSFMPVEAGDSFVMRVSRINPSPQIRSFFPNSLIAFTTYTRPCEVRLVGEGFVTGMEVTWNGTWVESELVEFDQVRLPTLDCGLIQRGENRIQVSTAGPGGGSSEAVFTGFSGVPTNLVVTPAILTQGSPETKVTIRGVNILPESVLIWNGAARSAQYVAEPPSRGGRLEFSVDASELMRVGTVSVLVRNPAPGGGDSPPTQFSVRREGGAVPLLSNPQAPVYFRLLAAPPTRALLTGAGFTPQTRAYWDGIEVPTEYLGENSLFISPPVADVTKWGSHEVYVSNGELRSLPVRLLVVFGIVPLGSGFDSSKGRLYLLAQSPESFGDRELMVLNSNDGSVISRVSTEPDATGLALSDDGKFAYWRGFSHSRSRGTVSRFDLASGRIDLQWDLPVMNGSPFTAESLITVKGAPETLIVGGNAGVLIYDGDRQRARTSETLRFSTGFPSLYPVFATATRIYLTLPFKQTDPCWAWLDYDAEGIQSAQPSCSSEPPEMRRDGGLAYLADGSKVYAASLPSQLTSSGIGAESVSVSADLESRRAWQFSPVGGQLLSFDMDSGEQSVKAVLRGNLGWPKLSTFPTKEGVLIVTPEYVVLAPR